MEQGDERGPVRSRLIGAPQDRELFHQSGEELEMTKGNFITITKKRGFLTKLSRPKCPAST
jgi:hypothetical protein